MATANPAMDVSVFRGLARSENVANAMTIPGTAIKTGFLLVILLIAGAFTWTKAMSPESGISYGLLIAGSIGGLATAFATIFFPKISPITAPLYAGLEGLVLGAISAIFETRYPGIALQAVSLSIGVLVIMLLIYATRIIPVTNKVRIGIVAATGAVCLVYVADFVLALMGVTIPYIHESGAIGIGFSVVVVVIAALNLILDFDFIEQGAGAKPPSTWSGTAVSPCWSHWCGCTSKSCACWRKSRTDSRGGSSVIGHAGEYAARGRSSQSAGGENVRVVNHRSKSCRCPDSW